MRRLVELHEQRKADIKLKLTKLKWKYSITFDVWTSKNQLSFFGFTIHYIDDNWVMKEGLLAFKFFGIADRLLGVTADNASDNTTVMENLENYYALSYPENGFSVLGYQIECLPHVVNLAAQQILKMF